MFQKISKCKRFFAIGWGTRADLQASGPGGVFFTKYKISVPMANENSHFDDLFLALPEKDQLAKSTKELPIFIKFLKFITDKEKRANDFLNFLKRVKEGNGLVVESSVFLNLDEVLALMWKNGFSENERNALQFTFPGDYQFHYPELAVLFNISEEDAYKFCLRTRMDQGTIGELDLNKTKRRGVLRDHWLLYAGGWYLFKSFPFFNYLFFVKSFGFSLWFVSMWSLFSRQAHGMWRRQEFIQRQKVAAEVLEGEDKLVQALSKFANDGKSVDYLKEFKTDFEKLLKDYKAALLKNEKAKMTQNLLAHLNGIFRQEIAMKNQLQEKIVEQVLDDFKTKFATEKTLRENCLTSAIQIIKGDNVKDPILSHVTNLLKDLTGGNSTSEISQKIHKVLEMAEGDFKNSFMFSKADFEKVKGLIGGAMDGNGNFDIKKLNKQQIEELANLQKSLENKIGFFGPTEEELDEVIENVHKNEFLDEINEKTKNAKDDLLHKRLTNFVKSVMA